MKLLKASLTTCQHCRGARHGCAWCGGNGYHVHDRSYEEVEIQLPKKSRDSSELGLKKRRMEDGVCADCGKPDLLTQYRCKPCSEKYNEMTAAAKRKSRNGDGNKSPI